MAGSYLLKPAGRSPRAGEIRGRLALLRGDSATAISELEQVERDKSVNDEENIGVWFHLGTAYLEAGRLADARSRFEQARLFLPTS